MLEFDKITCGKSPLQMPSVLQKLAGLTVTNVVKLHDYLQLHFGDKIGLSIYNELSIEPETTSSADLVGKMLISINENRSYVSLNFLDGTRLRVNLRPEGYRGPEALQLNREGEPPVIWN